MNPRNSDYARIDELFAAALERAAGERAAFLDKACPDEESAELRKEVEELLRLSETQEAGDPLKLAREGELLGELAKAGLQDPANEGLSAQTRIGAYQVSRELARGGMGVVYLAERVDGAFEQEVAIKVLRTSLTDEALTRRFHEERRILASLQHPHIARLYDGGTLPDGRPYFAMEYIRGERIDRYCDRRQLSVDKRLELFETVAHAVHHAHRNLVVHRDIKPSNILVDSAGEAKLLDFGIARFVRESGGTEAATRRAERRLTPEYTSPELLLGEVVTTASDVYQLGLVLYELLTGDRAHRSPSKTKLSTASWERLVCQSEPRRPSVTVTSVSDERVATRGGSAAALARMLRGDLDNIVLMALRKEPERRYASAEQFARDIGRFRSNLPVLARKSTVGYRASKWIARNRVAAVAAVVILLSLVAGLIGTSWQAGVAKRQRDQARTEAATADQVTKFLLDLFEVADPSESRGQTVTAQELLERGAKQIDRQLADQPVVRARLLDALGRVHHSLGLHQEAEVLLDKALSERRAALGSRHLEVAESLFSLAALRRDRTDPAAAEELYGEVLSIRREQYGNVDHPEIAAALSGLGGAVLDLSHLERAEDFQREALTMQQRLLGENHVDTATTLGELAVVLHSRGDLEDAESLYRQSLDVFNRKLGDGHPSTVGALSNLAALLRSRGEGIAAEPLMRRALASRREIYGSEHERVASAASNFGMVLADLGHFEEAEQLVREALSIRTKNWGDGEPKLAMTMVNMAYVIHLRGDLNEAEPIYAQAVALALQADALHSRVGVSSFWHGKVLAEMGRHAEAEPSLRRATEVYREVYGGSDGWSLDAQVALASSLTALGKTSEAENQLLQVSTAAKPQSEQRRKALEGLVDLYDRTDRGDSATRARALLAQEVASSEG